MKRVNSFEPYTGTLPYASEIFGVYQPMIGWRSQRMRQRVDRGFAADRSVSLRAMLGKIKPVVEIETTERGVPRVRELAAGQFSDSRSRSTGTFLSDALARQLPPLEDYRDEIWDAIDPDRMREMLNETALPAITAWATGRAQEPGRDRTDVSTMVASQLQRESAIAGLLVHLKETKQFAALKDLFYKQDLELGKLRAFASFTDPLDYIDPFHDIDRVGLSPVGIVHLFRQYFFEFDTFLGPPVGHVWMSPGSTVELLEVTTRRTLVERTLETELETVLRTEKATTEEDELSDAVKQENRSDTKFAMSATLNQGWIGGSATATTSLNMDNTQSKAREQTHRRMRQQSEKLSTEIRKNVKSTFRTVTETTDTSSKRYVLGNATDRLINYELRRKMRQVGVQVHDIGTYLCWQTYVDDPGRQLGIAKLVHIAKDPELGSTPPPESVPMPTDVVTQKVIDIPFIPLTEDTIPEDDMDEAYRNGVEVNLDTNEGDAERIKHKFDGLKAECDQSGYEYRSMAFDYGGADIDVEVVDIDASDAGVVHFGLRVRHVNFRNASPIRISANVTWQPTQAARGEIDAQNKAKMKDYNAATTREFKKAFVDAAKERINQASRIESRPFDDLREEERIVVYRALIQEMLTKGIPMPDDRTRHVVSELLNAIFDIDKMLYFVAPEWWRPRLHQSHQNLGGIRQPAGGGTSGTPPAGSTPRTVKPGSVYSLATGINKNAASWTSAYLADKAEDRTIDAMDTVAWGGVGEGRSDNYYITSESEPARMGSSLGWLLQLDGDALRNAFLNAPWVKAVIPIRPGREQAAMNWLSRLNVEGSDGLDDDYVAPAAELAEIAHDGPSVTIRDALEHLCKVVAAKHEESLHVTRQPTDEINDDNRVSATPVDKVYEHGFYPLQGGFRATPAMEFEVFDQWIEVLPTDQVVPVEVTYDPITGRQV